METKPVKPKAPRKAPAKQPEAGKNPEPALKAPGKMGRSGQAKPGGKREPVVRRLPNGQIRKDN